jgi:hypothetical protein
MLTLAQTISVAADTLAQLPKKVQSLLDMPPGAFVSILYGKECKMRSGVVSQVYKFSKMTLRCGIEYNNVSAVVAKRESGELPAENHGLSWGKYVDGLYPYIIEHKGSLYFRMFTVPNSKTETTYVLNGKEIARDEAMVLCPKSEFPDRVTTLETVTLKVEGIIEINNKEVI